MITCPAIIAAIKAYLYLVATKSAALLNIADLERKDSKMSFSNALEVFTKLGDPTEESYTQGVQKNASLRNSNKPYCIELIVTTIIASNRLASCETKIFYLWELMKSAQKYAVFCTNCAQ